MYQKSITEKEGLTLTELTKNPPKKEDFPQILGARLMVIPCVPPEKTKGGIIISDTFREDVVALTNFGMVLDLGEEAYERHLPQEQRSVFKGPWVEEGDWVIFAKYAGTRHKYNGVPLIILNEGEIIAKCRNVDQLEKLMEISNI